MPRFSVGAAWAAILTLSAAVFAPALCAPPASAPLKSGDVIARVEGMPITRRELTYYWMQTRPETVAPLVGAPILEQWKADRGAAPLYALSPAAVYRALYADPSRVAPVLSSLITNRLAGIVARRRGVVVTDAEVKARAHAMFDAFRKQNHISQTDNEIMREFRVPRDIFYEDVRFKEQTDRMTGAFVSAELAARNGHQVALSDWLEVRRLFVDVKPSTDFLESERRFAEGRKTLDGLIQEIRAGKPMEQAAKELASSGSEKQVGLLPVCLRGACPPMVEQGIAGLKPGELSAPVRGRTGWYIFRIERAGDRIPVSERKAAWQALIESRRQAFLEDLLQHSHITSTIPLSPSNR